MAYVPIADGQRVTAAQLDNNLQTLIFNATLAVATASVVITVPAGYYRLEGYYCGKSTAAAASDSVNMQLNGDTGTNYNYTYTQSNNSATTTAIQTGKTSMFVGTITAATSTANYSGSGNFVVEDVTFGAFFPTVVGTATGLVTTTNMFNGVYCGQWLNASTIVNSVTLFPAAGSWAVGSSFSLYGMPG